MSMSVTVLMPHGRRQIIKVTPNTNILQILEDVCKKHGFTPSDYDLKHHNKVLDVSNTVRFSNLPNNALLELKEASQLKIETPVTIGLQLENGERLVSSFSPEQTLWDIAQYWCHQKKQNVLESTDEHGNTQEPVCIYMRQEIAGEAQLKSTTLRSLGLTTGKAMLRLGYRPHNKLREQPFVENLVLKSDCEDRPLLTAADDGSVTMEDVSQSSAPMESPVNTLLPADIAQDDSESYASTSFETCKRSRMGEMAEKSSPASGQFPDHSESTDTCHVGEALSEMSGAGKTQEDLRPIYLDDRGSLLYCLDEVTKPIEVDLPDEFYDVTIDDVKKLMVDLKRKRQELEDIPLRTQALRDAENLTRLRKYPKAVLRIQFPDRLVLQGCFKAVSTVSQVHSFVKSFLFDSALDFYLYTAPPKRILNENERLFEIPLVPSSIVHFGCDTFAEHYLRDDVLGKISSPASVNHAYTVTRTQSHVRSDENDIQIFSENTANQNTDSPNAGARSIATNAQSQTTGSIHSNMQSKGQEALPKWFQAGK